MNRIIDVHHHWIPPHHARDLKRVALPGQTVREKILRGNAHEYFGLGSQ